MNILIYTQWASYKGYQVGGAETSLRLLSEKLAERGHNVQYLTELKEGRWFKRRSEKINGVTVHFINLPDLPTKGISLLLKVRQLLIEYCFRKVAQDIITSEQIELVYTYHEIPGMQRFLKLKKSKNLQFKTVLRNGGKFWTKVLSENHQLKEEYRSIFNSVDSINFNTAGMETLFDDACEKFSMDLRVKHRFVHDIGMAKQAIDQAWKLPANDGPFRVMMASRFSTHQKRQDLLVDAIASLNKSTEFELLLVGDGKNKEHIRKRAEQRGVLDRVKFYDFMEQKELWELMKSCHLYVHACDFEGLSKIIIEAMGMGMPVMASDVTPIRDYIEDGNTGFLVENDPVKWAERLAGLSKNRDALKEVSINGKEYASKRFSPEKNAKIYERYFQSVIEGR